MGPDNVIRSDSQPDPEPLQKRKVIVELGWGGSPFIFGRGRRQLKEGEIYIGIDRNPSLNSSAEYYQKISGIPSDRLRFIQADVLELTKHLSAESVDEVVLCNFLGAPETEDSHNVILEQIKHVLNPTGRVIVAESYTPNSSPKFYTLDTLRREMEAHGFGQQNLSKEMDINHVRQYVDVSDASHSGKYYIAEFTKVGSVVEEV